MLAKWRARLSGSCATRAYRRRSTSTVSPGERQRGRVLDGRTTGRGAGARIQFDYTLGARVYDYDVTFRGVSPYLHGEISPTERLRVTAGLRYDDLTYDFDNRVRRRDGDGSRAAGRRFRGTVRFYGQAGDTDVQLPSTEPEAGRHLRHRRPTRTLFASYSHGFRAPSEGQMFRPSSATTAPAAIELARIRARRSSRSRPTRWKSGVRGVVARRLVRPRGLRPRQARRHRLPARSGDQVHADRERRQDAASRRRARRSARRWAITCGWTSRLRTPSTSTSTG